MITDAWNGYALNVLSMRYKLSSTKKKKSNIKNKLPQTMNEIFMESMIVFKWRLNLCTKHLNIQSRFNVLVLVCFNISSPQTPF